MGLRLQIAHQAEEAGQSLSVWVERVLAAYLKAKVGVLKSEAGQ
jgi:hypothetical protein